MAALKILNISKKRPKGMTDHVDGLLKIHQDVPLSPVKEEDEDEMKQKKMKAMELIRKYAPDMPAVIATKMQGRTLASSG